MERITQAVEAKCLAVYVGRGHCKMFYHPQCLTESGKTSDF